MNQILAVENEQKNKNKKKKKNTTADIQKVITVFCVISILFGIAITGQGVYAIVSNFNTGTSQEEQVAEQNISIDSDTNTGKVIISGTVPNGVQSIKYKWNEDEEQTITKNGETEINEEIDLPVGNNNLTVTINLFNPNIAPQIKI